MKDCNLMDTNSYIGLHDIRHAPTDAGANGVWSAHAGGGVKDTDAGFILGTFKRQFSFGIASEDTGRMTWLQVQQ